MGSAFSQPFAELRPRTFFFLLSAVLGSAEYYSSQSAHFVRSEENHNGTLGDSEQNFKQRSAARSLSRHGMASTILTNDLKCSSDGVGSSTGRC
ncbi:hypothetical protein B0H14DRAFT_2883877 [Mycena olivaceomarginata]|nr:hypothetical protein B0H14DRAFT_2883877 [Mycena olivaceomarginata]